MGILSTGIKAGAMYGIARQGIKAYENHGQQRQSQCQYATSPPQAQTRDINGYAHQSWCNGLCQGQCNGSGYAHQAYCNGQCGCRCNGEQSQDIRQIDSLPQAMSYPAPNTWEQEKPPKY